MIDTIPQQHKIILTGDLNARIRFKIYENVVGPFGKDTLNLFEELLIELCKQYSLKILNGIYEHKLYH